MQGPDAQNACNIAAYNLAGAASGISGIDYEVNSMVGITRIHTRVTTVTTSDYWRERHHNALRMACETMGGNVGSSKGRKKGRKRR